MSCFWARSLLTIGSFAALLGISSTCRAERPAAWRRGPALLHLAAARDALSSSSARNWGLSYSVDEMYAGPWANSPFAHGSAQGRAAAVAPERTALPVATPTPSGAATTPATGRAAVESALSGLGPLGLLASALIPAVVASSASAVSGGGGGGGSARSDVAGPRVGFAKLASGYGIVVSGRFY